MTVCWRTLWPTWPVHILSSCSMQNWWTAVNISPWSVLSSYSCILQCRKCWITVCSWGTSVAVGGSQPWRSKAGECSSVYSARRLPHWTTFWAWSGMSKWIISHCADFVISTTNHFIYYMFLFVGLCFIFIQLYLVILCSFQIDCSQNSFYMCFVNLIYVSK